ncbi:MAG: HlyD family efflux transporter periplasmic adaptor subunit [Calothrix sp. MO_192.B10]|nr:HlyD family efflux transporter periplasmic adaptor subunit [Calothrix sp. MO_192.B10]
MKLLPKPVNDDRPLRERPKKRLHLPRLSAQKMIYGAIAIGIFALVVWAFRPVPIPVETAKVSDGKLQVTVDAEGKTRIRDRFIVSAPVNGRLTRIKLYEGDRVKEGDLLARIEPLPLTSSVKEALGRLAQWQAQREGVATQRPKAASLEQARTRIQKAIADQKQQEAKVAEAQAALQQAKRDRQRAQRLQSSGAISRQNRETAELNETTKAKELETARLAAKSAASEVEVARAALTVLQQERQDPDYLLKVYDARIASVEAELEKLRDDAARTDIRAPVAGKVLRIQKKSAQFVTSGTSLLELGNVSQLELVIDVLSRDAVNIKPGNSILIDGGRDMEPLLGRVRLVEPAAFTKISALGVEEQRVNVIGDFISSSRSLGDAYRVDVRIVVWEDKDVLQLPLSALFRCGKSWCVFTVKDGKANRKQIKIGHRSDLSAEIQQGISRGEEVILHPTKKISHGIPVVGRGGEE